MPQIKREEIAAQFAALHDNESKRKLYYKLAKKYHPDKYNNKPKEEETKAADAFRIINEEYVKIIGTADTGKTPEEHAEDKKAEAEHEKIAAEAREQFELDILEEYISIHPLLSWAYKRFASHVRNGLFKKFYLTVFFGIVVPLKSKEIQQILKPMKERSKYIHKLGNDSATPKAVKLANKVIARVKELLSKGELTDFSSEDSAKLKEDLESEKSIQLLISKGFQTPRIKLLQGSIELLLSSTAVGLVEDIQNRLPKAKDETNTQALEKLKSATNKEQKTLSAKKEAALLKQTEAFITLKTLAPNTPKKTAIEACKAAIEHADEAIELLIQTENKAQAVAQLLEISKHTDEKSAAKAIQKAKAQILQQLKRKPIKPNTLNIGITALLYLIYASIFTVFSTSIQVAVFGTILLGGSILTNILFGIVAALIITPIAITILKIKNNIDSNKLFNLFFFCAIFAAFTFTAPAIELWLLGKVIYTITIGYKLMLGLVAAVIAYTTLNIIELIIKNLSPDLVFFALSFIKDIAREMLLTLLFAPLGELLFKVSKLVQECKYSIAIHDYIELISLTIIFSIIPIPETILLIIIIASLGIYYNKSLSDFISNIFETVYINLPNWHTNLPNWHTKFIELAATPFSYAYDFIQTHLDKSATIASSAYNIFSAYRANIPAKLKAPAAQNKYLNYALIAVTFIAQAAIDTALLPIFMLTYPIYKAVKLITKTMYRVGGNNPKKTAAFFIITAALCATFASPIQLFVLGHIVMAGSPVINVMFGTLASLASTLFGANACALTNAYVKPSLSKAFAASSTAFNDLQASLFPCLSNLSRSGPKT